MNALPPITSRREAIELAEVCLEHLISLARARGGVEVEIGLGTISVVQALKQFLRQSIADVVQAEPRKPERMKSAGDWARRRAWEARERIGERIEGLRGLGAFPGEGRRSESDPKNGGAPRSPTGPLRVLALPRTNHHLRDMLLVAEHGRREPRALEVSFIAFTRRHAAELKAHGLTTVLAGAFAPPSLARVLGLRTSLAVEGLSWANRPPVGVEAARWAVVAEHAHWAAQSQLVPVVIAAGAITRAMREVAPDLVLVGNPCMLEGSLGVAAAHASRLPSAAMQHGDFSQAHAEWGHSGVSMITTWGEGPASTLVALGVPRERIAVTGAPWADRLIVDGRAPRTGGRRRILVALSGAGHAVGLAEHTAHVRRILEASAELGDHEVVFRLHPKDTPALYHQLLRELPGAKATIVEARDAGEIHEMLTGFDLAITVTSTSATDAMLHGIPVLTIARPLGEGRPAFVEAKATTHVGEHESLAGQIRRVLAEGERAETRTHAKAYVERFFGTRDGRSTERVVDALRALAGR